MKNPLPFAVSEGEPSPVLSRLRSFLASAPCIESRAIVGNVHQGVDDLFVMKLNSSGVWQWTCQRGTRYEDRSLFFFDQGALKGVGFGIGFGFGLGACGFFRMRIMKQCFDSESPPKGGAPNHPNSNH